MKPDASIEFNVPSRTDPIGKSLILDSIPIGVICLSPERKILQFNPQAEKLTGYGSEEALGRFCGDILHGGYCQSKCPLETILAEGDRVVRFETTIRTRLDQFVPVAMTSSAMFTPDGMLVGAVEAFEDISRLKELEKERSNLISMLSHDMKSPVVSIGGFARRLMNKDTENLSSQQMNGLKIIRNESDRLESMVNELLEFSRLQTGRFDLNMSPTSLDKVLIDLFEAYQPRVRERGLELKLDLNGNSPIIQADEDRIRRVLTNLIDNALKFSKDRGAITIRLEQAEKETMVMVKDEGIGIDPEDLPYIFGAFFRGRGAETVKGSGLGLAVVKTIVEGHGGSVHIESEPGRGTTLRLHLPF